MEILMTNEELESFINEKIYNYLLRNLDLEYNTWNHDVKLQLRSPSGDVKIISVISLLDLENDYNSL